MNDKWWSMSFLKKIFFLIITRFNIYLTQIWSINKLISQLINRVLCAGNL